MKRSTKEKSSTQSLSCTTHTISTIANSSLAEEEIIHNADVDADIDNDADLEYVPISIQLDDDDDDNEQNNNLFHSTNVTKPTNIRLKNHSSNNNNNNNSNNSNSISFLEIPIPKKKQQQQQQQEQQQQQYYTTLNEYIHHHPILYNNARNDLYQKGIHYLSSQSNISTLFPCNETQQKRQHLNKQKKKDDLEKPIIYVHQREIAHVSNQQYKTNNSAGAILVTDNATTCHCFALRSYCDPDPNNNDYNHNPKILASLCHLDSTSYQSCLEEMIQTHYDFHHQHNNNHHHNKTTNLIMEIHIVGGYNDSKHTSIELTNYILNFLDELSSTTNLLSNEFSIEWRLETCIVSSLNDRMTFMDDEDYDNICDPFLQQQQELLSSFSSSLSSSYHCQRKMSISSSTSSLSSCNSESMKDSNTTTTTSFTSSSSTTKSNNNIQQQGQQQPSPMIRGLAIDVNTGQIQFIRKVHSSLWGPEPTLRRARLWSPPDEDDDNDDDDHPTPSITTTTTTTEQIQHNFKSLLQIHTYTKEQIYISPYEFKPFDFIDVFYKLPDHMMLSMGSTSPDVEDDDFCVLVRETCYFLMNVKYESVFPLRYIRRRDSGNSRNCDSMREKDGNGSCKNAKMMQRVGLVFQYDGENWWQSM